MERIDDGSGAVSKTSAMGLSPTILSELRPESSSSVPHSFELLQPDQEKDLWAAYLEKRGVQLEEW